MAVTHGFIINEAATSVTAPLTATEGLRVVVGTAPVNMLAAPAGAVSVMVDGVPLESDIDPVVINSTT